MICDKDEQSVAFWERSELCKIKAMPVVISDDVFIGALALVLKGGTIGKGAVVGARLVARRDVPAISVVAGNPAKV